MVSSFVVAVGFFIARKSGLTVRVRRVAPHHGRGDHGGLGRRDAPRAAAPTARRLLEFYRQVRPAGPGWTRFARESGSSASPDSLPQALLGWMLGCTFVYSALFGTGSFLYGRMPQV